MLINFNVENFRSFRDRAELSLQPFKSRASEKETEETHWLETKRTDVPHLLRSAVIYGANSSGKRRRNRKKRKNKWKG
jgi:AAA15 family ATPase/GTPase